MKILKIFSQSSNFRDGVHIKFETFYNINEFAKKLRNRNEDKASGDGKEVEASRDGEKG